MYLSELTNAFIQISKCICSNKKNSLSKLELFPYHKISRVPKTDNVHMHILKNGGLYLDFDRQKCQNIFVQIKQIYLSILKMYLSKWQLCPHHNISRVPKTDNVIHSEKWWTVLGSGLTKMSKYICSNHTNVFVHIENIFVQMATVSSSQHHSRVPLTDNIHTF